MGNSGHRVIVLHPATRLKHCVPRYLEELGYEVTIVDSVAELHSIICGTYDALVIACCVEPGVPLDGLATGFAYQGREMGDFEGVVVGIACCNDHLHQFSEVHDIAAGPQTDYRFACDLLGEELDNRVS